MRQVQAACSSLLSRDDVEVCSLFLSLSLLPLFLSLSLTLTRPLLNKDAERAQLWWYMSSSLFTLERYSGWLCPLLLVCCLFLQFTPLINTQMLPRLLMRCEA